MADSIHNIDDDEAELPANNWNSSISVSEALRMAEAILFASAEPVTEKALRERLPSGVDVAALLGELQEIYSKRGINLRQTGGAWAFRTAADLAFLMNREAVQQKKLSRAALEVLAIIAYHQPVTRAELEDIRGVETSKGTLDVLMETGLDQVPRAPAHPRPSHYLRDHCFIPRPFRPAGSTRSAGD